MEALPSPACPALARAATALARPAPISCCAGHVGMGGGRDLRLGRGGRCWEPRRAAARQQAPCEAGGGARPSTAAG